MFRNWKKPSRSPSARLLKGRLDCLFTQAVQAIAVQHDSKIICTRKKIARSLNVRIDDPISLGDRATVGHDPIERATRSDPINRLALAVVHEQPTLTSKFAGRDSLT
jgi:hypothetical protein